jgi:hypothetical protein
VTSRRAFSIFVAVTAAFAVVVASCTSETGNPVAPAADAGGSDQTTSADASSDASEGLDQTVGADSTLPDAGPPLGDSAIPDASHPSEASPPDSESEASPSDSGPKPDAADASGPVSAIVDATGAMIQLADGTQLLIPAGALTAPLLVTLTPVAPPTSGTWVGATVRVDPVGTTLLAQARITLPISPALIPDAAGSQVVVARSPDGIAPFVALTSLASNVQVNASTASFGVFAAMLQSAAASLFITTISPLPPGTVGTPYTTSFTASGGAPPYTWSVPSGSAAPPGLALSAGGVLSGTPTTAGKTLFFVLVTDSLAHATQASFECDINPVMNPVPVLTAISPVSAPVMSSAQTVVLTGSNFVPASVAQFDGNGLATTYSSSTQLTATIPGGTFTSAGTHSITVLTPAPGGGTSAGQTFTITAANLAPTLTSASPSSVPAGSADTKVELFGTNFLPGPDPGSTLVQAGAQALSTAYYSPTLLEVTLPASLLAAPGTLTITATNPPPGGGTSAPLLFSVIAVSQAPSLTSLAPSGILVGSADTQITLTGTNFVASSAASIGPQALSTAYVSATELLAIVPAALLATKGTLSITVTNPSGGGTSNALGIQVVPPGAPTITSISPATIPAGSLNTTITVTGTNLDATGRLYFSYPSQVPIHTTVTSSTTATGVVKECMLRVQQTASVVYAANAADAGAPPDGGATGLGWLVIGPPVDAGAPCDPAACSLVAPPGGGSGIPPVCENNRCCSPGGAPNNPPQAPCCTGLTEPQGIIGLCLSDCLPWGPVPVGAIVPYPSCCGDYQGASFGSGAFCY